MNYVDSISLLSNKFLSAYPQNKYPELMRKSGRPYTCLLISTHNYHICIPFRSSINHQNAFLFRNTRRSLNKRSGLDYSKVVLITEISYISNQRAIIDSDEFAATKRNMSKIVEKITSYIDIYVKHVSGIVPLHYREFARKYGHSTLPYFHDILGLSTN